MNHACPHIPAPTRRAFTLLEIMLAMIIGSLVLVTALATFAMLNRADRHNERRLESSTQLAQTHRAVEMALRSMILSNTRAPVAGDPVGTPRSQPQEPEPEEFERPRVLLSARDSDRPMVWEDGDGRLFELAPQRLEITIERPPVFAEPEPGTSFRPVVHRMYASRRERDREQRREEIDAERRGERDENPFDGSEPAIAAGVRGVFELTFEPQVLRPGDEVLPEGGSWTLWWQTLPPVVSSFEAQSIEGLSDEEIASDPMYRPVRLISGLRWARWEAVRAGETLPEFSSTWWEDLPAYVTLEIQTNTGKWSKWMFEVQGTRGPEPGTEIGGAERGGDAEEGAADENLQNSDEESGGASTEQGVGGGSRLFQPSGGRR